MTVIRAFTPAARARIGTAFLWIFSSGLMFACTREGSTVDGLKGITFDRPKLTADEPEPPDSSVPDPDPSDPDPGDPEPTEPQPSLDASVPGEPEPTDPDASVAGDVDAAVPADTTDCVNVDWTTAARFEAPNQNARELWAVMKSDHALCVWIDGEALDNYVLYLDTDANATTGYESAEWPEHSGAEYAIMRDGAQQILPDGTWQPVSAVVNVSNSGSAVVFDIDLTAFLQTSQSEIWLGFELLDPASAVESNSLPAASFARVAVDGSTAPGDFMPRPDDCPGTVDPTVRANFSLGRGIIIPAYIGIALPGLNDTLATCTTSAAKYPSPTDACMWLRIQEGARKLASTRDYWVAVNGPNSGPLAPSQWDNARTLWDPIRAASGRIFGYVHTNEAVANDPTVIALRTLETVEQEIQTWVQGYSNLDGIWIDEYNPRFELFGTSAAVDQPWPPGFPNPICYTPKDRAWIPGGMYNTAIPIKPAGGYYKQLTDWIKLSYPNLKIIGNAGGALYSNQNDYGNLVDVLVSTERTYEHAAENNWGGLVTANPAINTFQLALIHSAVGTATDAATREQQEAGFLLDSVTHAAQKQYTHLYVGYKQPDVPGAPPPAFPRVWGIIPPFFEAEVDSLASW